MNQVLAALGVFVLALGGAGALRLGWPQIAEVPRSARLALGFCAGACLVGIIFFTAYLGGVSFSRWLVLGPIGLLAVIGVLVVYRSSTKLSQPGETPWLAALLVVVALAISWGRPIHGYDALMMWGLKAKMAFFAQTWPPTMFDKFTTAHTEYPPVVPSAQAFVFFWLGEFDDVASRVVFAAWFAAGAVIIWWLLGQLRASSRTLWILWWCAVPVALEQVSLTYADLPHAVYLLVFYGALAAWLRDPQRSDWAKLAGIFGGLAFWVKQDAMIGVGAGIAALLILAAVKKMPWRPVLVTVLTAGAIALPWRLFVWLRDLPSDFAFGWSDIAGKSAQIAGSLLHYTMIEGGFTFFWPVILLTIFFRWRKVREPASAWLAVSLLIAIVEMFAVYWFSKDDLRALLPTSMERVLIGLMPAAIFLGAQLWRGHFKIVRWQFEVFIAGVVAAVALFWWGTQPGTGEDLFLISAWLPSALLWVWLVAGLLTIGKLWSLMKRHGSRVIWRAVQFAVVVATLGLALVTAGIRAGACGETWRQFGGKTLMQQHLLTAPPALSRQIGLALQNYPPGTHVKVLPKRSLWKHRFYYETFPDLVVDSSATNLIQLTAQ